MLSLVYGRTTARAVVLVLNSVFVRNGGGGGRGPRAEFGLRARGRRRAGEVYWWNVVTSRWGENERVASVSDPLSGTNLEAVGQGIGMDVLLGRVTAHGRFAVAGGVGEEVNMQFLLPWLRRASIAALAAAVVDASWFRSPGGRGTCGGCWAGPGTRVRDGGLTDEDCELNLVLVLRGGGGRARSSN